MKACLPVSRRRKRNEHESTTFDDVQDIDADTFLHRVMAQAERLPETPTASTTTTTTPDVVVQPPPPQAFGSAASAQFLVSHRTVRLCDPPPSFQCSRTWVYDTVLGNFGRLRQYLEWYHAQGVGGKDQQQQQQRIPVPAMRDQRGWVQFCGGVVEDDDDDNDNKSAPQHTAAPWWENLPKATGYTPTVSLLLQMDQVMVRRVLGHLVEETVSPSSSSSVPHNSKPRQLWQWMYGLLARLEKPIHRDDAVVLYKLLQHLTYLRARGFVADVSSDKNAAAAVNVLIVVIGLYFEQGGSYEKLMVPQSKNDNVQQ